MIRGLMVTYYIPMADPGYNYTTRQQMCPHIELAFAEGWSMDDLDGGWPIKCLECADL